MQTQNTAVRSFTWARWISATAILFVVSHVLVEPLLDYFGWQFTRQSLVTAALGLYPLAASYLVANFPKLWDWLDTWPR